jgi:molecular chaperone GrpE
MPKKNKTMTDSVSNTDALRAPEGVAAPAETTEAAPGTAEAEPMEVAAGAPAAATAAAVAEAPCGEEPTAPADDGTGEETEAVVEDAVAELAAVREELASLNDRYLRLAAEFTNYRRRVEQERTETWGRAQGDLVSKFLGALDDLQRVAGLDLGNATVEGIMEGIDLVDRKFERILAEAGVEVVDPAGERFDPETMEAMMRVPAGTEEEDDHVAQVFQKGYTLRGQLLRPARVSVLKLG